MSNVAHGPPVFIKHSKKIVNLYHTTANVFICAILYYYLFKHFFLQSGDFFKKPNLKVYFITHNLMLLLFKQYHIYGVFFLKIDGENDNDSFDITAVDTLIR